MLEQLVKGFDDYNDRVPGRGVRVVSSKSVGTRAQLTTAESRAG
jgi:hypothetical protein